MGEDEADLKEGDNENELMDSFEAKIKIAGMQVGEKAGSNLKSANVNIVISEETLSGKELRDTHTYKPFISTSFI